MTKVGNGAIVLALNMGLLTGCNFDGGAVFGGRPSEEKIVDGYKSPKYCDKKELKLERNVSFAGCHIPDDLERFLVNVERVDDHSLMFMFRALWDGNYPVIRKIEFESFYSTNPVEVLVEPHTESEENPFKFYKVTLVEKKQESNSYKVSKLELKNSSCSSRAYFKAVFPEDCYDHDYSNYSVLVNGIEIPSIDSQPKETEKDKEEVET